MDGTQLGPLLGSVSSCIFCFSTHFVLFLGGRGGAWVCLVSLVFVMISSSYFMLCLSITLTLWYACMRVSGLVYVRVVCVSV